MIVDVIGDVVTNIQNQGDIYDEIINIVLQNSDELVDNGDGTFTHTAVDGTVLVFDANTTCYANNGDGTYTFTNANGDSMTIDIIADVVTNIQNQGDIYDEIVNLVDLHETLTVLTDNGDGTFTYTDENGDDWDFDANTTTMVDNGDGTYDFTNANGDTITVDVIGDVVTNIQNQGDIYNEIVNLIDLHETLTELTYDENENTLTYTDEEGNVHTIQLNNTDLTYDDINQKLVYINSKGETQEIDLGTLVAGNETITTLVDHGDGTFTYTNEEGTDVTFDATRSNITDNGDGTYTVIDADGNSVLIDIPGDIVNNFEAIVHSGPVTVDGNTYNSIEEYFEYLIEHNETLTALTYDENENQLTYQDEDGNTHIIQLNNTNLTYDNTDQKLVYTNSKGETQEIDLGTLVAGNETITTLVDHGDGTFTYTNEEGTDVTFDATRSNITDNGDGTYTVIDADGNSVLIDIPGDIVNNFETIVHGGPVTVDGNTFNNIEKYFEYLVEQNETLTELTYDADENTLSYKDEEGVSHTVQLNNTNLAYNDTDQKLVYTNSKGEIQEIDLGTLVAGNETVTTLVANTDGTYTYTSEDNTVTIIDIPNAVIENFETIVNGGPVDINGTTYTTIEEYITNLANSSVTIEGSDFITVTGSGTTADPYVVAIEEGDANSMLITNAAGDLEWATIESIVQANETVTTLVANTDGTYTYTSEDNTVTIIDIPNAVIENFETIVNGGPVDINGTTYTTIEEYITNLANSSVTIEGSDFITVTGSGTTADPYVVAIEEGDANSMLITNATGDLEWATIESIVQANETVTTLVANTDGTYTYTSEDNTVTIIDIPNAVIENFETIVNGGPVDINGTTYTTIEEYITNLANSSVTIEGSDFITVTGSGTTADPYVVAIEEGDANSMLITNATGDLEWATIESIVQANETVTTLVANTDGTYTYTSEDNTVTIIDIPNAVIENFETIVNGGPVDINGTTYTTIEEYITNLANSSVTIEGSDFITVTRSGRIDYPYVVAIEEGDANSMLITNAAGDLEWATIESIVNSNIDAKDLTANTDGTYTYTSEDNTVTIIDIPNAVIENFETIVNGGPVDINGTTYTTIEEYITNLANSSVTIEGSDFITVTGSGTTADPYVVAIEEGDANSMLITNATGDLEWATIESIVQANETVTTLVANTDGTYTYTS